MGHQVDLDEPIDEQVIAGRLCWIWADGTTHPVIRGGAVDLDEDEDEDEDVDDEDEDSNEDSDDGDDDEGDDGDDGDDDTDAWVEAISEEVIDKVTDRFESMLDRRITKLTRTLTKRLDEGDSGSRRSRSRQRDDSDDFSDREARLVGNDLIRDELSNLSAAERNICQGLLTAEIARRRNSGDDEETVGESAGRAVIKQLSELRSQNESNTKRAARKRGAGAKPQPRKAATRKSPESGMQKGAARALERRPQPNKE